MGVVQIKGMGNSREKNQSLHESVQNSVVRHEAVPVIVSASM